MKRLSVIVPVFNEEPTLVTLLDRVAAAPLSIGREIVLVDDGSTDASPALMDQWAGAHPDLVPAVLHRPHAGKGAAVREGVRASRGDLVIIQDADLEYDPTDYEACVAPILAGRAAVVYGSRERLQGNRRHSSLAFYLGGLAVSACFRLLYGTRLTDEPTCYKTFDGPLIRALLFDGDGFEWEPEITAKLLRLGIGIAEVPIHYAPRGTAEGKKIRWTDGVRAFREAFRWRFRSVAAERRKLADWQPPGRRNEGPDRNGR